MDHKLGALQSILQIKKQQHISILPCLADSYLPLLITQVYNLLTQSSVSTRRTLSEDNEDFVLAQTQGRRRMIHPAFLPALRLPLGNRGSNLSYRCRRTESRRPPLAAWEDILPPQPPPSQQLSNLLASHPTRIAQLHLCAIHGSESLAYANASSSITTSLPIPCESKSDTELVRDTFSFIQALPCPNPVSLVDASVISRVLDGVKSALNIDQMQCNTLTAKIKETCGLRVSRLEVILSVLRELNYSVLATEIVDTETTSRYMRLSGALYVMEGMGDDLGNWGNGIGLWDGREGEVKRLSCTPCTALCIAHGVGVECFVERNTYDGVCVRNSDRADMVLGEDYPEDTQERTVVPWELTADDVLDLSDAMLKSTLKKYDIPTRAMEARVDLLRKFVKLMDEVQRRELGIILAAEQGRYQLASDFQKGRSKRGLLLNELKEAEKREEWNTVLKLSERLRVLEDCTMDITAEPGSYSKLLDRDDWYRPNR